MLRHWSAYSSKIQVTTMLPVAGSGPGQWPSLCEAVQSACNAALQLMKKLYTAKNVSMSDLKASVQPLQASSQGVGNMMPSWIHAYRLQLILSPLLLLHAKKISSH